MLVPFVIDAESIAPDGDWTVTDQRIYHEGLLETWRRMGVLVHDGQKFENSRIKEAIDALPQKLLPLWQDLLEQLPIMPGQPQWDGIACNNQNCMNALSASANVVLLDDAKAEVEFGLNEAELSKVFEAHPSLEFCRILAAAQAQTSGTRCHNTTRVPEASCYPAWSGSSAFWTKMPPENGMSPCFLHGPLSLRAAD